MGSQNGGNAKHVQEMYFKLSTEMFYCDWQDWEAARRAGRAVICWSGDYSELLIRVNNALNLICSQTAVRGHHISCASSLCATFVVESTFASSGTFPGNHNIYLQHACVVVIT